MYLNSVLQVYFNNNTMKKEQPKNILRITHIILNFTCKRINHSKGMNTKQYKSKKKSETNSRNKTQHSSKHVQGEKR